MLAQHAARLIASLMALDRALEDAGLAAESLTASCSATDAVPWLPGIHRSLAQIRVECADLRFAARAVRDSLPSVPTLQPRLL